MSTIAVYDYDYFHYENVIPNLECAKLVTYYRAHNQICILVPQINTAMYGQTFARKDYDDGLFSRELFLPSVTYGGRAFNPKKYSQLAPEIEKVIPDMHIYDKYVGYYGQTQTEQKQIARILNAAHLRIAPDSEHLLDEKYLLRCVNEASGIILHDYDIAALPNIQDRLKTLQDSRRHKAFKFRGAIDPIPIGNKFPICVKSETELESWQKLVFIPNLLLIEYCGLMTDEQLFEVLSKNQRLYSQLYYNVTFGCTNENQFLVERAPQIFLQALFLRRYNSRILLKYDDGFFVSKELQDFITLLNCFMGMTWQNDFLPGSQTLYRFVLAHSKLQFKRWTFKHVSLTTDEIRNVFQYIREHNYELFKMFYELDSIIYDGGKLVNEWHRDSSTS